MTRWKESVEKIISFAAEPNHALEDFFNPKNYLPQTEEEKHIFEEFSLITSSMAILIHVAKADDIIKDEEKKEIIDDLIFQLEQRPFEYSKLSEKFGQNEREIIQNIFDKILADYQSDQLDLTKIINVICLIYQNNPAKRFYLIRLCFFCALSDFELDKAEKQAIRSIAHKMKIPAEELKRIEAEVEEEIAEKGKRR
ncbi:MAG TPA: TerB family tellurite resistance protein [Candidatus Cloacimonadota bacterium]|nr:TerB family tellurite resistance protein [Candidatus Cloacimonadota bacterium]